MSVSPCRERPPLGAAASDALTVARTPSAAKVQPTRSDSRCCRGPLWSPLGSGSHSSSKFREPPRPPHRPASTAWCCSYRSPPAHPPRPPHLLPHPRGVLTLHRLCNQLGLRRLWPWLLHLLGVLLLLLLCLCLNIQLGMRLPVILSSFGEFLLGEHVQLCVEHYGAQPLHHVFQGAHLRALDAKLR